MPCADHPHDRAPDETAPPAESAESAELAEHGVDLAQLQRERRERLQAELLTTRWFDYSELAELRGASVDATRFWVHNSAPQGGLLAVSHEGTTLVPAFQLTDDGGVRPELAEILAVLLGAGMDSWDAWIWLTQPAGLLAGAVPHEAAADPEEATLVQHAARRLADRITASR